MLPSSKRLRSHWSSPQKILKALASAADSAGGPTTTEAAAAEGTSSVARVSGKSKETFLPSVIHMGSPRAALPSRPCARTPSRSAQVLLAAFLLPAKTIRTRWSEDSIRESSPALDRLERSDSEERPPGVKVMMKSWIRGPEGGRVGGVVHVSGVNTLSHVAHPTFVYSEK